MLKWTKTKSRNGSLVDASDIEEHFRKDYEESAPSDDLEYVFGSPDRKHYYVRRKSTENLINQSTRGCNIVNLSYLRRGSSCLDLNIELESEMKRNIECLVNLKILCEADENFHKNVEGIDEDKPDLNSDSCKSRIFLRSTETTAGDDRFVNEHYGKNNSEDINELSISRFSQSDTTSDDEVDFADDCHNELSYTKFQCYCCTEDDDIFSELNHHDGRTIICSGSCHDDAIDNVNRQNVKNSENDLINNNQINDNLDYNFKSKEVADSYNASENVTYNYSRDEYSEDNVSSGRCDKSINHLGRLKSDQHFTRRLVRTNSKRKKWRRKGIYKYKLINTITTDEENERPVVVANFVHREKNSKDDTKVIERLI